MRKKEDFALNSGIVVAGNHLASLLAGIAVICTVFAMQSPHYAQEAVGAGDQGLMFVYLAALFGQMPGGTWFFGPLFFLVLVLAGLSSLIAMMELAVRNVIDFGIKRKKAVVAVVLVTLVGGIPSALDLDVLTNQDNVWGVGLLISGLFAAVAMMRYGLERARRELDRASDFRVGTWWKVLIGMFPLMAAVVFGWFMYLSITDSSQTWYDPFQTFSVGTMVLQWVALFVVMLLLNNLFSRRTSRGPLTAEGVGSVHAPAPEPDTGVEADADVSVVDRTEEG
ncbi:hypothetical protein ACIGW3_03380 [Streptomyces sp. NPDC053499]|uniref:hypothetical protein n=1 Tax=Streptomyces sp. NPDC053499 TaxID=3365707 RepID=UPI0037D3FB28